MKPRWWIVGGAVGAIAIALGSLRADRAGVNATRDSQRESVGKVIGATEVIGNEVQNFQHDKLGKVDDLVLDVETGRIVEILVSSGGVLGIGDRLIAVPPGAVQCVSPHPTLKLDAAKEKIKAAPGFQISKWEDSTRSDRVVEAYRYFSREPDFALAQRSSGVKSPPAVLGNLERATKVIGAKVETRGGVKVGKVENLMIDVEAGRIVQVIVSSERVPDRGNELRAIPPAAFTYFKSEEKLAVNVAKDTMNAAPSFKGDNWPDFNDPAYTIKVYRAYRVESDFDKQTEPDNTGRNARDRNEHRLTPLDQGASEADVEITRRIRREILADRSLSSNARNIKIITVDGRVTLRGPVDGEEERRRLEAIAHRIASDAGVINEVEVKNESSRQ